MAYKAFIVGVNTLSLEYCARDAQRLRASLEKYDYEIISVGSDKPGLQAAFESMLDDADQTDTLILYFSGHGLTERGNLWFLLADDATKLVNKLNINEWLKNFSDCRASNKLVMLDCCHAGQGIVELRPELSERYLIFAASARLEKSIELEELKASFFTHYLCQALDNPPQKILEHKKNLSVQKLYSWLKEQAQKHNGQNDIQVPLPKLFGSHSDFALAILSSDKALSVQKATTEARHREGIEQQNGELWRYDAFISYSHADEDWVRYTLLPPLQTAGLKIIDDHYLELGETRSISVEQAIMQCRKVLLVLTPDWIASEWDAFKSMLTRMDDPNGRQVGEGGPFKPILARMDDPNGRQGKVLPLLLKPCDIPNDLAILNRADFTDLAAKHVQMKRLLRVLGVKSRVFISYKPNIEPEESLVKRLSTRLTRAGHKVFIEQAMPIGVEWAREIEHQIEASDNVIVLLSAQSIQGEMVAQEVEFAYKHFQITGKPRLLPVRVNYSGPFPYQLSPYLGHLHYAEWHSDSDTKRLIPQLLDAIGHGERLAETQQKLSTTTTQSALAVPPAPYADPRFLDEPGGTLRLYSTFYIERKADRDLRNHLKQSYGTTTTIRAPRQTGKSSLLVRGIAYSQKQGNKAVFIDLQSVDDSILQDRDAFLHHVATITFIKLGFDPSEINDVWQTPLGALSKITTLMEECILPRIDTKMVLAIDEADRLLHKPSQNSIFGLLRSWHNNRAINELWDKLDILMVISTESHLLINDLNQSPFNVGLRIKLDDFDVIQTRELNRHYESPLRDREVPTLLKFLSGHPYLTHRALYTMKREGLRWSQLFRIATADNGPFNDHLRRYLWILRNQEPLRVALKQVIIGGKCPDEISYYRLLQAGLIKGSDSQSCMCRCKLYEEYLKDKF